MRGTRSGPAAAATAAAVALLLGGCGSGDTGDGGKGTDGGSSSSTGTSGSGGKGEDRPDDGGDNGGGSRTDDSAGGGGADTGGTGGSGGGGEQADLSPYLGPWASGTKSGGGRLMVLIVNKDATVSLAAQDVACQGTLQAAEKPAKLSLECRDRGDAYTSGTITELNGKTLTVKWGSGRTSEFRKGAAPAGPPGE